MKRPHASLDPTPSSPTRKRSRGTGHGPSYPEAPTPASPSSTDSSKSTLVDSPPKSTSEHGTTSSEPDESSPDTNSDNFSSSTPSEPPLPSPHSSTETYNTDFWNKFPVLPAACMGRGTEPDDIIFEDFTDSGTSDSASISDDIPDSPVHLSSSPVTASDASSSSASSSSSSSSPGASNTNRPNPIVALSTENLTRLQSRLGDFLPKIKSANEELEVERAEERLGERDIENVDREEEEGREYIEMNLGLGVLEEKEKSEKGKSEKGGSEECESEGGAVSEDGGEGNGAEDAVERLLRSQKVKGKRKVKIEEVQS